ncbi:MAG: hypothetical protein DMG50_02160 [Acidobacteria bacterium]|nr:MAG: hypothetical protein DMG50_02160 [Acidobacteriota bacterium]
MSRSAWMPGWLGTVTVTCATLPSLILGSRGREALGEKSPVVVVVTEPDGKVLMTEGQGQGKVRWNDLKVVASVVTANQKGIPGKPSIPA